MMDIRRCNHTQPLYHCSGKSLVASLVQVILWMGVTQAFSNLRSPPCKTNACCRD